MGSAASPPRDRTRSLRGSTGIHQSRGKPHGVSEPRSFAILLVSPSAYRIDGAFRYEADELPGVGELIAVQDELGGTRRTGLVQSVNPGYRFPIHAIEATTPLPERSIAPHELSRRQSVRVRARNGRRGWLRRQRRRAR